MTKKHSVSSIYLKLSIGLSTLIVIIVGATLMIVNTQQHNEMVSQVSEGISTQLKGAMTLQVDSTIKLIDEVHIESKKRLKEKLAQEVRQAHRLATKILKNNSDLPLMRQKELIINSLRPVRFDNERSSIFIVDTNGKLQLNPKNRQYEGADVEEISTLSKENKHLISATIQHVKDQGELYIEGLKPDFMNTPGTPNDPTVVYYKYLDSLDWVIGTQESIDIFEEETKEQLLGILSKLPSYKNLQLFIANDKLHLLALPGLVPEGKLGLYEALPENAPLIEETVRLARNNKSKAIKASWFDQRTGQHEPILLYMRFDPNWKWLIGAFVTLSDIEQEIGLNKSRFADRVEEQALEIAVVLVIAYLITVIVGLLVYRKIEWHFNLFIERLQSAAHENHPIIGDRISIQEFDTLAQTMNEQLEKRAALQQELERLAQKDPLTGLCNRRRMDELLSQEIARTKRNKRPFSLIISDIDHFKNVNDTFGHETGDKVICAVAEILQTSLREQDSVARWGGEEFLIVLPDTQIEQAVKTANKIRMSCENHIIEGKEQDIRFTLTFGVAEFDGSNDIKEVIAAADLALYEGKHQGRNVVICSNDSIK